MTTAKLCSHTPEKRSPAGSHGPTEVTIPKQAHPDKWHLAVNHLVSASSNANKAINPDICSIAYTYLDDTANLVNVLLAKFDW